MPTSNRIQWVRKLDPMLDEHLQQLYTVTEEVVIAWGAMVRRYAKVLRRDITIGDIERAVRTGDPSGVLDRMAWTEANGIMSGEAKPLLQAAIERAGRLEMDHLKLHHSLGIDNPYVYQWIENHTAELVTQITPQTQKAIQTVISDAFRLGDAPRKAAMPIRDLVGLTERDAKAVMNYWRTVAMDGNRSAQLANDMADTYARKLLQARAESISRTETINASARGAQYSWKEAGNQGLLLSGSMQEWIAAKDSPRTCEICLNLDGQRVPLGQPFYSSVNGAYYDGPTAHTRCRCGVALVTEIPS